MTLTQLTIRDFAIVERLTVEWMPGLNVLTGETGAGKSIIIDAVGALLGGRMSPDVVRTGANRAVVEGLFDVRALDERSDLHRVLAEYGLEPEDGSLILSRDIAGVGGRGVARVNGRAVPSSVLQQVGEHLIDIHGQSEHLSLLRPREHLELLDRYAGLGPERARLAEQIAELRAIEREEARVRDEARRAAREQELLRHEVDQIDAAALRAEEEQELQLTRERLRNVERLRSAVATAYAAINGDEDRAGAVDLLGEAVAACAGMGQVDPTLASEAEALQAAASQVDDSARALRRYLDQIEDDPEQLQAVEERLLVIADLKRKFGDTVPEIIGYADQARERLRAVEQQDQLLADLAERRARIRAEAGMLAGEISSRRAEAAERLRAAVEGELADLSMAGTRFEVQLQQAVDAAGLPVPSPDAGRRLAFDPTGVDRVEFMIAPNPGEEPKGLGRIASGGELSRVSLALKSVLSQADRRGTLIFDEIDVGVGGRSAPAVGEKLWGLTTEHQVLCVTHMPQVAAYADAHLVVNKGADDQPSHVSVRRLEVPDRVEELAAMLGGQVAAEGARRTAEQLLAHAEKRKAKPRGLSRR